MRFIYATLLAFIAVFSVIRYAQAAPHTLERRTTPRLRGTIKGIMDKRKGDRISSVTIEGTQLFLADKPEQVIDQRYAVGQTVTFVKKAGSTQLVEDIHLFDSPAYVTRATSTSVALKEYTSGRHFFVAEEEMAHVRTLALKDNDQVTFQRGEMTQSAYHVRLVRRAA